MPCYSDTSMLSHDEDNDELKQVMLVALDKKSCMPLPESGTVGNTKVSSPVLINSFAYLDAQKQKVATLALSASGMKHVRFEVPNREVSTCVIKMTNESHKYCESIATMGQAMRP